MHSNYDDRTTQSVTFTYNYQITYVYSACLMSILFAKKSLWKRKLPLSFLMARSFHLSNKISRRLRPGFKKAPAQVPAIRSHKDRRSRCTCRCRWPRFCRENWDTRLCSTTAIQSHGNRGNQTIQTRSITRPSTILTKSQNMLVEHQSFFCWSINTAKFPLLWKKFTKKSKKIKKSKSKIIKKIQKNSKIIKNPCLVEVYTTCTLTATVSCILASIRFNCEVINSLLHLYKSEKFASVIDTSSLALLLNVLRDSLQCVL